MHHMFLFVVELVERGRSKEKVCVLKMSLSRKVLSAQLERKTLSLEEKVKLLDFKKKHPKKSVRDIAEVFKIGKTSAATILKNSEQIRKDYETFQGNPKRNRKGKYSALNDAMFTWYSKCCQANLYPTGRYTFIFQAQS